MYEHSRSTDCNRRQFLSKTGCAVTSAVITPIATSALGNQGTPEPPSELAGQLGIVSASVSAQMSDRATGRRFTLLELPQILREELDMTVIDLNDTVFPSFEMAYLDKFRDAADRAGCVLTNLKMNQRGIDMNSDNAEVRKHALDEYKKSIDAAAHLGLKWARPLPQAEKPDISIHIASYQELCDYAADRNVEMLVENFGWMQSDPDSVVKLVKSIGRNVAACPDTGNWDSNELRYTGLARTFPIAVTCDFKARTLGPNGEHELYDLERCFEIGWKAGFRGPWCFEHANADTTILFRELGMLRDMLRRWMDSKGH